MSTEKEFVAYGDKVLIKVDVSENDYSLLLSKELDFIVQVDVVSVGALAKKMALEVNEDNPLVSGKKAFVQKNTLDRSIPYKNLSDSEYLCLIRYNEILLVEK